MPPRSAPNAMVAACTTRRPATSCKSNDLRAMTASGLWNGAGLQRLVGLGSLCASILSLIVPAPAQTPVRKPATCDRPAFRVLIDVGHTLEVPGAISARGATEYDYNLRLAREIAEKLVASGFASTTLLITDGEKQRGLVQRVSRANQANGDVLLSIHHDAVPEHFLENWEFEGQTYQFSDRFKGHSLFVSFDNAQARASLDFARILGVELKNRGMQYTPHYTQAFMGSRRRDLIDKVAGVYRFDQLYVLRAPRMPAVLLEAGVIKNRDEELLLASAEHRALLVAAAVDAIDKFCMARMPVRKPAARSVRR